MIVSNRLPVDYVEGQGDGAVWRTSPGGLVAALEPVMRAREGAWIGWAGVADEVFEPFNENGIDMIPVALSSAEVEEYYEGFSNDTLWPLYHDVIAPPSYHREWWDSYRRVNRRFAEAAASATAPGAVVWVHDYQLQLVPRMLREIRPDLVIGFFNHIPFPAYGIYSQLPWRRQIIEGLLGADVVGFQRVADAGNFARAVRRLEGYDTRGSIIEVPVEADVAGSGHHAVRTNRHGKLVRTVLARQFPISTDAQSFQELAKRPDIVARAKQIREDLGNPKKIILGVDRLDYTKGIRHRLKAYGELLTEGAISAEDVTLVQVASPSRERVGPYMQLRDEIELIVGRLNGDFSSTSHTPINYLHHSYPREEMVALYLAADVMLVTALRDGMNLVAKEYVATRIDNGGVLILSEFAGAADELKQALLINPHDIEGLKHAILTALEMPERVRTSRMRSLRRRVLSHDVQRWSSEFLSALAGSAQAETAHGVARADEPAHHTARHESQRESSKPQTDPKLGDPQLLSALRTLASTESLLLALDFDGTLAPLLDDPWAARILPKARVAIDRLNVLPGTHIAYVSGRPLADLRKLSEADDSILLVGSHGAETRFDGHTTPLDLSAWERDLLAELELRLESVVANRPGVALERKPLGLGVHTRLAEPGVARSVQAAAIESAEQLGGFLIRNGKDVVEFAVRSVSKGDGVEFLRARVRASAVLFAGDDVTDEDGFAVLRSTDVGIKVGEGASAARFRVADPAELARTLSALADVRTRDAD